MFPTVNPVLECLRWILIVLCPLLAQLFFGAGCVLPLSLSATPTAQTYSAPVQDNHPNTATGGGDAITSSGLTAGSVVSLGVAAAIAVAFLVLVFLAVRTYRARNGYPTQPQPPQAFPPAARSP
jgi:hypothetical protein